MSLTYSSLKEVYGRKENFNNKKDKKDIKEKLMDYNNDDDCYYKKFGVNMESCKKDQNVVNKGAVDFCDNFANYNDVNNDNDNDNDNKSQKNCNNLQTPKYEYPVSDESKKKYKEALDVSMKDNQPISYDEFNKRCKLNNIKPYEDDDIDQYLNISNFKDAINYPPKIQDNNQTKSEQPINNTSNSNNSISTEVIKAEEKSYLNTKPNDTSNKNDEQTKKLEISEKKNKLYSNYINIGLFIFIGIAVILLCDQIAEIAINIGMRKTARILEPYLNRLQNINSLDKINTVQVSNNE